MIKEQGTLLEGMIREQGALHHKDIEILHKLLDHQNKWIIGIGVPLGTAMFASALKYLFGIL